MGCKRTAWHREREGVVCVGFTMRPEKAYEKRLPPPTDGGPIDENYVALVKADLLRAHSSGGWDPELTEYIEAIHRGEAEEVA